MLILEVRIYLILLVVIIITPCLYGSPVTGRKKGRKRERKPLEPWQLNQDICPPALCGPALPGVYGDDIQLEGGSQLMPLISASYQFFEGDIVLDSQLEQLVDHHQRSKRAIVKPSSRLWKYGIVPYKVNASVGTEARLVIEKAIDYFKRKTCIQFIPREKKHKNYLLITNQVGCWSLVGQTSGRQLVSIGRGCEQLGTVLHELGHALGFWHEQSRPDRDKYVEVVMKNVAPRYYSQFGKRDAEESTSRSYAYDYLSIMHYKDKDFSKNHRRTIKVIGEGQKQNFKIGQRKKLSDIDIAQLNDMYSCNLRDITSRACNKGWTHYKGSCYKFVYKNKKNFGDASQYCKKEKSYLVHINNAAENTFIKGHLIKHYKAVKTWRIGGKKYSSGFMWFDPSKKKKHIPMKYKPWSSGYPKKYNTAVLILNKSSTKFVWGATWTGSDKNPTSNAYAFICETKRKDKCFKSKQKDGRDYRGKINFTKNLITCQHWTSQYPHRHKYMTHNQYFDLTNGLGDHNYCRNPGGRKAKPWCFTSKFKPEWEYCDVNIC